MAQPTRLHRRPRRHANASRGFTLVEVLVALLVMAVMAGLGWQGVAGMARARAISQEAGDRSLRLSAIVQQFEADLLAIHDATAVPGIAFDGAALRLARRTDGGVQVVMWSLRDGAWLRWASPAATRTGELQELWLKSTQLPATDPGQLRLLTGASEWQLYFFRSGAWSNAQSSADVEVAPAAQRPASGASGADAGKPVTPAAPAAPRNKLPSGVRLQITLPEGQLTRDVALVTGA